MCNFKGNRITLLHRSRNGVRSTADRTERITIDTYEVNYFPGFLHFSFFFFFQLEFFFCFCGRKSIEVFFNAKNV